MYPAQTQDRASVIWRMLVEFNSSFELIPLEVVEGVPHSKSNLIHFSIDEKQLLGDSEAVLSERKEIVEIEASFLGKIIRRSNLESESRWLQELRIAFFWRYR